MSNSYAVRFVASVRAALAQLIQGSGPEDADPCEQHVQQTVRDRLFGPSESGDAADAEPPPGEES